MVENKAKSVSIFKVLLEPDYVGMENPSHQIALPHFDTIIAWVIGVQRNLFKHNYLSSNLISHFVSCSKRALT